MTRFKAFRQPLVVLRAAQRNFASGRVKQQKLQPAAGSTFCISSDGCNKDYVNPVIPTSTKSTGTHHFYFTIRRLYISFLKKAHFKFHLPVVV